MKYQQYLDSPEWASLREKALERDGHRCMFCNKTTSLHVHHVEYPKDLKNDKIENLITLCKYHHARQHNKVAPRRAEFKPTKPEPAHISVVLKRLLREIQEAYEGVLV